MVHRGSRSRLARLLACLLASSSLIARAPEDFYKILGVDRGADERTLKKNYRIKALKHHPDKGGDPETFAELSRAYETLTDPEKRRVYDEYGEEDCDRANRAGDIRAAVGSREVDSVDSVDSREVDGTFGSSFRAVVAVGSVAVGSAAATRSRICLATRSAERTRTRERTREWTFARASAAAAAATATETEGEFIRQDVAGDESASGEISGDGREEYLVCGVLLARGADTVNR